MRADSVGAPVTPQQWDYIHEMGGALRSSLDNVTAVFAPSCIGHAVLTKRDWLDIKIDDISLAEALRCWERSTQRRNKERRTPEVRAKRRNKKNHGDALQPLNRGDWNSTVVHRQRHRLSKEERKLRRQSMTKEEREKRRQNRIKRRQKNAVQMDQPQIISQRPNRNKNRNNRGRNTADKLNPYRHNQHNKKKNRNNEHGRNSHHRKRIMEPGRCKLRLLERCSWPQCNHSCPALTNPLTGEEMRFLELLSSFGLDIEAVATALGVDMQTLNNMEHAELVNLLTQQVS